MGCKRRRKVPDKSFSLTLAGRKPNVPEFLSISEFSSTTCSTSMTKRGLIIADLSLWHHLQFTTRLACPLCPDAKDRMYLVCLKYWTPSLMPLMVYPKVLFHQMFSIKAAPTC